MKERIITGIFLVLIVLGVGYFDNYYLIWLFLGGLYLVAIFESLKLYKLPKSMNYYTISLALWISILYSQNSLSPLLILGSTFLGLIAYRPELDKKLFLPFIYPTIPFLILFDLYQNFGIQLLAWLILIVALTDTMAYFVGRTIGKRKFSPTSPKKTIEGVLGGIFFGTLAGYFLGNYILDFQLNNILLLSFVVSVFSIFGDLFESYLKREANIKDSGTFLPGHGGILDRVDGYMLSSVVLFAILNW
jgi:phosphatidate cytidylyltransferase